MGGEARGIARRARPRLHGATRRQGGRDPRQGLHRRQAHGRRGGKRRPTKEAAAAAPAPASRRRAAGDAALLYQIVETPRLPSNLLDAAFWEECACGGLTVGRSQAAGGLASAAAAVDAARASLGASGHARLPARVGAPARRAAQRDGVHRRRAPGARLPARLFAHVRPAVGSVRAAGERGGGGDAGGGGARPIGVCVVAQPRRRRRRRRRGPPRRRQLSGSRTATAASTSATEERRADGVAERVGAAGGGGRRLGLHVRRAEEHDALYAESDHPQHLQPAACVDADGRRVTDVHATGCRRRRATC